MSGRIIERLKRELHPQRIVLFGSHAVGGAGPDGDLDLLVVFIEALEADDGLEPVVVSTGQHREML